MFKQLAYSGTLEVTQIRKAGLNVRRQLNQFFTYYKVPIYYKALHMPTHSCRVPALCMACLASPAAYHGLPYPCSTVHGVLLWSDLPQLHRCARKTRPSYAAHRSRCARRS